MTRVAKLLVFDWVAQVMGGEPPRPRNLYAVALAEAQKNGDCGAVEKVICEREGRE